MCESTENHYLNISRSFFQWEFFERPYSANNYLFRLNATASGQSSTKCILLSFFYFLIFDYFMHSLCIFSKTALRTLFDVRPTSFRLSLILSFRYSIRFSKTPEFFFIFGVFCNFRQYG